ncbi:MAG: PadR family transcriptional regulator [Candidatus Altiarchaeota archaeon]|nr:PadR family transcriptional regulator [Candidatus Altiarchaeota archaeon]
MDSREIQRLKSKTSVEILWPYILALTKKEPVYAYEIRELIKGRFGFDVGNVTSYMVLYKLESSGLVKTEWKNVGNRQRKYYTITKTGKEELKNAVDVLKDTVKKLS